MTSQENNSEISEEETEPKTYKKQKRWDQVNPTEKGKKNYNSWRRNKFFIFEALQLGGGDLQFVKRYMLFKKGINIPSNVIRYYCHKPSL